MVLVRGEGAGSSGLIDPAWVSLAAEPILNYLQPTTPPLCKSLCRRPQLLHDLSYVCMLQTEVVTKLLKFTDVCARPSAKRLTLPGPTGPVNAVDVDGTLFFENDEAEAAAEPLCSKALELVPDVASEVAPAASEVAQAASEVAQAASEVLALAPKPTPEPVAALDSEPSRSVATSSAADRISYSAAASKPAVGPKPSVAAFQLSSAASAKFSAGLKRSAPASQPAVVLTPLEVNMRMHTSYL